MSIISHIASHIVSYPRNIFTRSNTRVLIHVICAVENQSDFILKIPNVFSDSDRTCVRVCVDEAREGHATEKIRTAARGHGENRIARCNLIRDSTLTRPAAYAWLRLIRRGVNFPRGRNNASVSQIRRSYVPQDYTRFRHLLRALHFCLCKPRARATISPC